MEKEIKLKQDVVDNNGNTIATIVVVLNGDGSTPNPMTAGSSASRIIGYNDDGTAIISNNDEELIKTAQQKFMAEAIKEQKKLCVENGVDPDLVNILNAEKKVNTNE